MKKIIYLLMIVPIIFASCEVEKLDDSYGLESTDGKAKIKAATTLVWPEEGCTFSLTDLIAGQHMVVGNVSVAVDGADYVITYSVTEPGWCLTEVHVEVAVIPEEFPHNTNSGNPKIGNFEYNKDIDCSTNHEVRIPVSEGTWIAAHGVVECSSNSPETILASLPETVDFCTGVQGPDSYLNITIDEGPLAGAYEAWCIDNDQFISLDECYVDASLYSSTGTLPDDAFEKPENFERVNYLLNQPIVGEACPEGGVYTYGDLQLAIWQLLDDTSTGSIAGLGEYSDSCVASLISLSEEGVGFVPDCDEFVGLIIYLDGIQPLIIPSLLECSPCDETVWAKGCDFPGNNWAMYFQYE